ncbi:MAG: SMP-30/gluconolactonase/LRE family protein [Candidatus Dormibacteraeota bacterium]|nr:SMP-30/gluconolactonase/LRE family protein [Candidatus Dormibacteraeota bacterium]
MELVLDARAWHGEGPLWDARQRVLWWVDVAAGLVHRLDPSSGVDTAIDVGQPVGAVGLREPRGLVLALRDGFGVLDGGEVRMLAEVEADRPEQRMNDGASDPRGCFWAGTMAEDERPEAGSLYRLDPDGSVTRMLERLTISNGIDWSPDGTRMYFVDSGQKAVDVFDYDLDDGSISRRRHHAELAGGGVPDGLCVDSEGAIWVARFGGWAVERYTPQGELERRLPVPAAQVTKPAFGGPDLRDLYLTTARKGLAEAELRSQPHAGSIFRARPGVAGKPVSSYRG